MTPHPDPDLGPLEDIDHPIPRLDAYDALLEFARGASVGILIATPLKDDQRSRARLRRKFEVALGYFRSSDFLARCGPAQPAHCSLYVHIHSSSDAEMLRLVQQYFAEVWASGITPVISSDVAPAGAPFKIRMTPVWSWSEIVKHYSEYGGDDTSVHALRDLAARLSNSRYAAGLFGWISVRALCIAQTVIPYPDGPDLYDRPHLRLPPIQDGLAAIIYFDSTHPELESASWCRYVPAEEVYDHFERVLLQELKWF